MITFNKIRITQTRKEDHRLAFVKELKDVTGFGLKEAKDESDKLQRGFDATKEPFSIEIDLAKSNPGWVKSQLRDFAISINEKCTGGYSVNGGTEWEREVKLLSLGLGSDDEYVRFISEFIMTRPSSVIEKFISEQLSVMDRTKLEETFNKLIEE